MKRFSTLLSVGSWEEVKDYFTIFNAHGTSVTWDLADHLNSESSCLAVILKLTSVVVCYGPQGPGRRSRTTSESSTHSGGRERSNSAIKQVSPPPPSIPEQPRKEEAKKVKKDSPKRVRIPT